MPNFISSPDMAEMNGQPGEKAYKTLLEIQSGNVWTDSEVSFINEIRYLYHMASKRTAGVGTEPGSFAFNGGHVELRDNGLYFRDWKERLDSKVLKGGDRTGKSSHIADGNQYEIALPKLGCILFGTRHGHTWFQNEAHAVTQGATQAALHGTDFVSHVATGFQQVGSLGYSSYSEKKSTQLVFGPDTSKFKVD